jgi:hypothetical protein
MKSNSQPISYFLSILLLVGCSGVNTPIIESTPTQSLNATAILNQYSTEREVGKGKSGESIVERKFSDGKKVTYRVASGNVLFSDDIIAGTEQEFASFIKKYYDQKQKGVNS